LTEKMMDLTNINDIKALLARHGFRFSKSMGQNFLTAAWVPEDIADSAGIDKDTGVLEIGPGIGCLTEQLSMRAGKVVSVEIDKALKPVLRETLGGCENVEIVFDDVLKVDIPSLLDEKMPGMRHVVCANLPYNITTPILMRFLQSGLPIRSITVMVQKEVADRFCAAPGDDAYGAVTAVLSYYGKATRLFTVSAGNFMPRPKVDSAVMQIRLYDTKPVVPQDEALMLNVVRAAFGQRRKTLLNALSSGLSSYGKQELTDAVQRCGLSPNVRGETMSIAQFAALADALCAART